MGTLLAKPIKSKFVYNIIALLIPRFMEKMCVKVRFTPVSRIVGFSLLIIILFSSTSVYGAEENAMETEHSESNGLGVLHNFHLVQIVVALFVAVLFYDMIKADIHRDITVYLFIAMLIFAFSAMVNHLPAISSYPDDSAVRYATILNVSALIFVALGFYKWRKALVN